MLARHEQILDVNLDELVIALDSLASHEMSELTAVSHEMYASRDMRSDRLSDQSRTRLEKATLRWRGSP